MQTHQMFYRSDSEFIKNEIPIFMAYFSKLSPPKLFILNFLDNNQYDEDNFE